MTPFYTVWNPRTKYTAHRHETYDSAEEEAKRLARAHAGDEFIVLMAVARAQKQDVILEKYDPIPF